MDKTGVTISVIGGIGLGLLLGSEFSKRYLTILGAILVIISMLSTVLICCKGKKPKI